jgi:hypothetical protein
MRDIRADLQERADLIEKQIAAANEDFEKSVKQLQSSFKAELGALSVVMMAEHYKTFLEDALRSQSFGGPPKVASSAGE